MLKRLVIAFIILLLLFLFVAKRGAGAQNLAVAQSGPEGAVLLLNLPNVYILPTSPLYFLVQIWEKAQLLLVFTPFQRADLFLSLAESKMVEVVGILEGGGLTRPLRVAKRVGREVEGGKESGRLKVEEKVLGSTVNYQRYLTEAYQFFNLVQDPKKRADLHFKLEKQQKNFELFKSFLDKAGVQVAWGEMPL